MRPIHCIIAFLLLGTVPVQAPDYPARPIKLVVPIGAGGGTDILARHMAQKMAERVPAGRDRALGNRGYPIRRRG